MLLPSEGGLERFGLDEPDEAVSGHQEIDALLGVLKHSPGWGQASIPDSLAGMVVNVHLDKRKWRTVNSAAQGRSVMSQHTVYTVTSVITIAKFQLL